MYVHINPSRTKGPFKCYVTLEGVGGYMPKHYEGVGLRQRYVTPFLR